MINWTSCKLCRRNKLHGQTPCDRCQGAQSQCQYSGSDTPVDSRRRSYSNPTSHAERKDRGDEELQLLQEIFSREHPDVPIEAKALERFYSHLVAQTSDDTVGGTPSTEAVGQLRNETLDQTTTQDIIYCDAVSTHAASVTVVNQGKTREHIPSNAW